MSVGPSWLAGLILATLAGCTAVGAGADPNDPNQVEVVSWWTEGSEKRAFDALMAEFERQHPGVDVIDASVAGGDQARDALDIRLGSDNPPDSFQATAGAGVADYVDDGVLQDLTDFADEGVFRDTFVDLLRVNGRVYSVPVAVRRTNLVWVNADLLRTAGVDPDSARTTISYWLDDLQRLRDAGVEYPLALGDGQSQAQLFENVLVADLGPVVYKGLWKDASAWGSEGVANAVADYGMLLDFVDPGSRAESIEDAVHRVVNGDAAYVVAIDSAASAFDQAEGSGHDYGAFPVPGTQGVFGLAVDAFTLPIGAAHDVSARAWLSTLSSAEGQAAFAHASGAIPARTDTDPQGYSALQQSSIASSQSETIAPSLAYGVAARPSWTSMITTALERFRDDHRPAALQNALRDAADESL